MPVPAKAGMGIGFQLQTMRQQKTRATSPIPNSGALLWSKRSDSEFGRLAPGDDRAQGRDRLSQLIVLLGTLGLRSLVDRRPALRVLRACRHRFPGHGSALVHRAAVRKICLFGGCAFRRSVRAIGLDQAHAISYRPLCGKINMQSRNCPAAAGFPATRETGDARSQARL